MKPTSYALTWIVVSSSATACPFGSSGIAPPNDAVHRQGLRRRLTNIDYRPAQRQLQLDADCLTEDTYDAIYSDIEALSAAHADDVSRGHFLGGIVRLAAHDFMDHDKNDALTPMGADGCIDWQHEANSGLDTIWCDDGCPLTQIYQEKYSVMSRADFWVASANAVIKLRSPNNELDLKSTFKWGRVDADQCPDSALRLPGASDCGQVQDVFLNRLGLTWTDAVALIGAHTLGRGSSDFSGHDGIWVDTDSESIIFDKRYYEEVLRRAWVPRNEGTDVQDWTWGGGNNGSPRFMLNTDMCLLFDVETTFPCCSRTDLTRNDGTNQCDTRNSLLSGTQCGRTTNEEAASAMLQFAAQRVDDPNRFTNDNVPFFTAFSVAWEMATTNGWDNLQELALSCVPTGSPTIAPSTPPTPNPTPVPTVPPTHLPTAPPTPGPTQSPTTSFSPTFVQLDADCLTEDNYDAIYSDIEALSAAHADDVSRGHFLGGIVRLAAHDFMDHDKNDALTPMGADGCIDWQHEANSGLDTIWCDDGCPLTQIYQEKYSVMSRADFWVASANAVIKLRSPNNELDLKSTFKWGRVDADQCPDSALRLPGASDCGQVQDVFLNRLGLTWTDAVALIGAHTLGRGSSDFSGHDGIWVDTDSESIIFDKRYYEEVLRRAWVPRNEGTDVQDWTWGGGNNGSPRFMLNTDMCLLFDVETTFPCCSRTDLTRNDGTNQCDTRNSLLSGIQCGRTTNEEAASAMLQFAAQRVDDPNRFTNDNVPFFTAFSVAWEMATTNGWDNLQELALSCVPTGSPTIAPSTPPTPNPTPVPTVPPTHLPTAPPTPNPTPVPTDSPTQLPTAPPTPGPTQSPTTSFSPTASCSDVDSFTDNNGRTRDCEWVIINERCQPFSHLCPVSCGECDCLLQKSVCTSGDDCCSGSCVSGQCACLAKNDPCSSNEQCCSDLCRDDGTCAGNRGTFETVG